MDKKKGARKPGKPEVCKGHSWRGFGPPWVVPNADGEISWHHFVCIHCGAVIY